MIPIKTKQALDRYVAEGCIPGGFLLAVLTNDLMGAVFRADEENLPALPHICRYVYNEIPSSCWGTKEKVYNYTKHNLVDSK